MKNKVNAGNQNSQQTRQNSANQPIVVPEKSKANYLVAISLTLTIGLLLVSGLYLLNLESISLLKKG